MKINEDTIIDFLKNRFNPNNVKSLIGDDAAVINHSKDKQVISIDTLAEGVHFKKTSPPFLIGKKLAAISLSDIAGMGGIPESLLISLAVPRSVDFKWISSLYDGIDKIANQFQVKVIGGDTVRSKTIVLSSVAIGKVKNAIFRNTVRINDLIYTTGYFGYSLQTDHHFNFTPRVKEINWLLKQITINSLTDASDGLFRSIELLSTQNNLGATINLENITIRDKKALNSSSIKHALFDGEDFELVFTTKKAIPLKIIAKFENQFNIPLRKIGVINNNKILCRFNGKPYQIKGKKFEHF